MDIDRLMIFVIVGKRRDFHCLRREIGIGSRSQELCKENLIRVQRLQEWLQDGKTITQEVWKLEADVVSKWWCQMELKIKVCEFCLIKMLQMTEVRKPD